MNLEHAWRSASKACVDADRIAARKPSLTLAVSGETGRRGFIVAPWPCDGRGLARLGASSVPLRSFSALDFSAALDDAEHFGSLLDIRAQEWGAANIKGAAMVCSIRRSWAAMAELAMRPWAARACLSPPWMELDIARALWGKEALRSESGAHAACAMARAAPSEALSLMQSPGSRTPLSLSAAHLWLGADKPDYGKILLEHDYGGWRDLSGQARLEAWARLVGYFDSAVVIGVADDWLEALGRHNEAEGLCPDKSRLAFALAMAGAEPSRFGDPVDWEKLARLSQKSASFAIPSEAMESCLAILVKAQLGSALAGSQVDSRSKMTPRL